jgi:RimJ/RimL family protein N-acetyltransferase
MNFIYGHDETVARWAIEHLIGFDSVNQFSPFVTLGIERSGELIAAIIYNNYRKHDIQITIVTNTPKWATKKSIREILAYPFKQLKCDRVTATIAKPNKKARKFAEGVGFRLEGVMKRGMDGKKDACIYGLLASECKWL